MFRVWLDRTESGAEYLKDGTWVWTPIPSSSIIAHPGAVELPEEDVAALLGGSGVEPVRPATRGLRR